MDQLTRRGRPPGRKLDGPEEDRLYRQRKASKIAKALAELERYRALYGPLPKGGDAP